MSTVHRHGLEDRVTVHRQTHMPVHATLTPPPQATIDLSLTHVSYTHWQQQQCKPDPWMKRAYAFCEEYSQGPSTFKFLAAC